MRGAGEAGSLPRCKPFKYTYEKEIVMYAHFKKLDYFSTECIYSPFAARGAAPRVCEGPGGGGGQTLLPVQAQQVFLCVWPVARGCLASCMHKGMPCSCKCKW